MQSPKKALREKLIYDSRFWSGLFRVLSRLFLGLTGWTVAGRIPERPKMLIVVAPHTSNWDFPVLLAAAFILRARVRYIGKHTLFSGPLGGFFYWTGGVPVDRGDPEAGEVIDQVVGRIKSSDKIIFVLAPEGTRASVGKWKSGFYRIARGADVPIVAAFLDARTRQVGIGPLFELSGDMAADTARIQAFYAGKTGINPKN